MSNEKPPIDHEARIKAQELINLAEDCNNDKVYTQLPEGISHPTEMYDPSPPTYTKENRPDWLKEIIEIKSPPLKSELGEESGL